ncbi:hypothetical protein COV58_03630 [Candidatus Roizmanbacteria bacterium CG11_big_fil_rev_8_21_14_0_20_36_8]|uniref:Uncharacterized protein n=1 Tax=Candidatus Roizmanbacteria bacterium CG11_big_fil_rev_8_21_14_0_20_36_8 TaxID=1974856 RepID=A0A2M6ITP6_9BACT|nr:MAG: hypothetical protein COV58_03630 [Candidatus Roizmanbacteria bacterium CG11_big_fil_rev_8_21_14_0_20_36_8]
MIEYTLGQYKQMLESIGFHIENLYGDYDGSRWNNNTWRTIILCQKPKNKLNLLSKLNSFYNFTFKHRWPTLSQISE